MGNFFNERRSGGRDGNRSQRPTMHRAVCDECGRDCEVPFKPSGDKPIYCSKCFEDVDPKKNERGSSRDFKKPSTTSVDLSPLKKELSSVNEKLDVLIEILQSKKEK